MKTVTVKFPEELLAKVDAAARRRGVPRSTVVRSALERFLEPGQSLRDWVDRHAGVFKGPRDLSYAKKHMKGFGR